MPPAVFPDASPMPGPMSTPVALAPVGRPTPRVRFAEGYEEFAGFASRHRADPEALRDDLRSLLGFLLGHRELLADRPLLESAGVFLRNTIATLHPESQWKVLREPSMGPDGFDYPVFRSVHDLIEHPEWHDEFHRAATDWSTDRSRDA